MTSRVDLQYAAAAAGVLDAILRSSQGKLPAEISTRMKDLPMLLQTSGLAATLAFYGAKAGSDALGQAYGQVGTRLRAEAAASLGIDADPVTTFFRALARKDAAAVAVATMRVKALATWLRRLTEAVDKDTRVKPGSGPGKAAESAEGRGSR